VRTNFEDDLVSSGRLAAFARSMKKDERDALGWILFAYRDTQNAKFSSGRREHLKRILSVRFAEHADRVIDAMIDSLLADLRRDRVSIRGNANQIGRLDLLRQKKAKAGVARASSATRGKDGTFRPAHGQHPPAQSSAPAPAPAPAPKKEREESEEAPAFVRNEDIEVLSLEKYYLEKRGHVGLLTRLPPKEKQALETLRGLTTDPRKVIDHFLKDKNDYYAKRKWPLTVLVDNIGQHLEEPTAAENPAVAARRALGEEQRKQREENERNIPIDPDAESKLKKILSGLI
jgi:hypothetical protein